MAGAHRVELTTMSNAVARSRATRDAVLLTEFGSVPNTAVLRRVASEADASLMPIEWAYCGCDDSTGAIPTSTEAVVLDPKRSPRGANVRTSTLGALERPYPQAVAGTPKRVAFNNGSGVFTLRYTTRRVAGHGRTRAPKLTSACR